MFEDVQNIYFEGPEVKMPQFVVRKETICPFHLEEIKTSIFSAISVTDSYISNPEIYKTLFYHVKKGSLIVKT
jgi:hypothetical protein